MEGDNIGWRRSELKVESFVFVLPVGLIVFLKIMVCKHRAGL